ncbi:MAG: hypothetical protein IT158_23375 [Bryobacterales bacterium]|nr:hypothetical protein [Bryobacterales bacterium]
MKRMRMLTLCILLGLTAALPAAGEQRKSGNSRVLTGYVDERPGAVYVLRDEVSGREVVLKAAGFTNQSFAKYLGHRVEARGRVVSGNGAPRMRVSSIFWTGPQAGITEESVATDRAPETLAGVIHREPRGGYVLRSENGSFAIAGLKPGAVGSAELKAYEGQRVFVEGELISGVGRPVLTVHGISPFGAPAR